ncbi:hypothetical protein LJC46_00090 [Desulfovibrio sp. OttesenSCG-928-G15]|nr:hypothetical protein [Desulfovibrio sp. OttesenSCG-928-G15]
MSPDGDWLCDADYSWQQMYPGKPLKKDIIYRALKENFISINTARGEMRVESLSGSQPPLFTKFKVVRQKDNATTIAYLDEPNRHEVFTVVDQNTLLMHNTAQPKVKIRYKRTAGRQADDAE